MKTMEPGVTGHGIVGCGVIGCGMIAETYHLPALVECEGVKLITACDVDAGRSESIGRKFGFENWTDDYHDVLGNPAIEAVFILTKSNTHKQLAEEAAKAGKHIFMQKSITDTMEDAEELLNVVKACGIHFTVSFMHRYFDECVKAAELLQENVLGELQQVRIQNCTKNPYDTAPSYGGCILDIGSHGIDLTTALFGSKIRAVLALEFDRQKLSSPKTGIAGEERFATLLYELEDGKRVIHEINWSSPSHISRFQVDIVGTNASMYIRNPQAENELAIAKIPARQGEQSVWEYPQYEKTKLGQRQHQLFIDDIRHGKSDSLPGEAAFEVLKVVHAAKRSMQSGKWEEVNVSIY